MADAEADNAEVKQALERLLAWPEIARSPQLANFLSYIVERRLSGDAQSIKAYSIAVDVFGRAPDFDPQADPIVRVQARRLRGLLEQYYLGPGAGEPLRILLPIGRYVPEFAAATTEPPAVTSEAVPPGAASPPPRPLPRPRGHVTLSWFVLLVLTLGAVAATYSLTTWGPRREQQVVAASAMDKPRLRIVDFQNLTGETRITPSIAALTVELVTDFEPLLIVDVAFGARSETAPPDDFLLSGVVRKEATAAGDYYFNAILTDAATNTVVWNWAGVLPEDRIGERAGIDFVSQELILRLGGPRGPLHDRAREMLARNDIAGQENFYVCGMLFVMYRTTPTAGTSARAKACFDALAAKNGDGSGNSLAAQASLLAETGIGSASDDEQAERFAKAQDMLSEALALSQTSSFIWEQQARLHEARGNRDMALAAYGTALQLNVANIDATAAYARHLALNGRLDLAVPLARRAINSVPPLEVPDWFQCVPALAALRAGNTLQAQNLALECGRVDTELGPVLSLLAFHNGRDSAGIGQVLPRILDTTSFRAHGVMSRLDDRISDERLLADIRETLIEAAVPQWNLDNPY
ncbi:tetratricopeptide repeat protein [Devosia sediminis]|uniref:Tetratricopeptide repeat protein n=1 Tax=Devosia sediminis TaxID=2798801 RepID=A0A934IW08_9HYPH|nr:hypothetical protein [Devosia sediminis]MBJ3783342.1 hypothetical protein [Devosia sediminis]